MLISVCDFFIYSLIVSCVIYNYHCVTIYVILFGKFLVGDNFNNRNSMTLKVFIKVSLELEDFLQHYYLSLTTAEAKVGQ